MKTYDFPNTHIPNLLVLPARFTVKVVGVILHRIPSPFGDYWMRRMAKRRRKELQELKRQVELMEAINRDIDEIRQLRQKLIDLMQ